MKVSRVLCIIQIFRICPLRTCDQYQTFKRVLIADFMKPEGQYKYSKMTWDDNKVYYRPNHQKKIRNFNVCFNLTTKTSKHQLDVSQLSDQCFSSFLLSLLTKNRSTFFLIFSWVLKKIIFEI